MIKSRKLLKSHVQMVLIMCVAFALSLLAIPVLSGDAHAQTVRAPGAHNPDGPQIGPDLRGGNVPGRTLGNSSEAEMWRAIRKGVKGTVSIPDKKAALLVQSEGDTFRAIRNGPISRYGAWGMAVTIGLLALYLLVHGRIRIEKGPSGKTIVRFGGIERLGHWLIAITFIILGLTGLNMLYGRQILLPLLGPETFSSITAFGKLTHDYTAFAFMVGLVWITVVWIRHNFPNVYDIIWLAKGGGFFGKGVHVPARKFNAGQKIIFWLVVLSGISLSLSGLALLFPFEYPLFAKTFGLLNQIGFNFNTDLQPVHEMQLAHMWHGIVALVMVVVIIAHIYIGTVGMEGAIGAMVSGKVDENWAREHHNLWVEEMEKEQSTSAPQAAE